MHLAVPGSTAQLCSVKSSIDQDRRVALWYRLSYALADVMFWGTDVNTSAMRLVARMLNEMADRVEIDRIRDRAMNET